MFANERRAKILALLQENGSVTVRDLTNEFNVSIETIRNDLVELENEKLLTRVHGGAISNETKNEIEVLAVRIDKDLKQKQELAEAAVNCINEHDIIAIDSGSTPIQLAKKIKDKITNLTVITNSLDVMSILGDCPNIKIIITGGYYDKSENAFYGDIAVKTLKNLHISKAFVSPSAVNTKGIYMYISDFYSIIKAFIDTADKVYVMATSTKFEQVAPILLSKLNTDYHYVTDSGLSEEKTQFLSNLKIIKI